MIVIIVNAERWAIHLEILGWTTSTWKKAFDERIESLQRFREDCFSLW